MYADATGEMAAWGTMWISTSNYWAILCLSSNKMILDAAKQPQGTGPCYWKDPRNGRCGSVHTSSSGLVTVKTCGRIHGGGLSFIRGFLFLHLELSQIRQVAFTSPFR